MPATSNVYSKSSGNGRITRGAVEQPEHKVVTWRCTRETELSANRNGIIKDTAKDASFALENKENRALGAR